MNGFLKATVAGLCLGTGLSSLVGCHTYRQIVDPCWPERYNAEARLSVRETFAAQAHNGHVLDQTVWNYFFEVDAKTGAPTDRLNPAGIEHLKYLARRRPVPDPQIYLQTAQEIPGQANMAPELLHHARVELDTRRIAAIQKYLSGLMTGRNQMVEFHVAVHDPGEVGIAALPISGNLKNPPVTGSMPLLFNNFKGRMPGAEGVTLGAPGGGGGGQ